MHKLPPHIVNDVYKTLINSNFNQLRILLGHFTHFVHIEAIAVLDIADDCTYGNEVGDERMYWIGMDSHAMGIDFIFKNKLLTSKRTISMDKIWDDPRYKPMKDLILLRIEQHIAMHSF